MGNSARALEPMHALSPAVYELTITRVVQKGFLRDEPGTDGGFNEETKDQAAGTARRSARYAATAGSALAPRAAGMAAASQGRPRVIGGDGAQPGLV